MEVAYWWDTDRECACVGAQRAYVGHETCVVRLPSATGIRQISHCLHDAGQQMTLVTPAFLNEDGLGRVCGLVQTTVEALGCLEVVCNDWGLLQWLSGCRIAVPAVGRFLAGQATDPRLAALDLPERQIPHERPAAHQDGIHVKLRYRRPPRALMAHLRSVAIDVPEVRDFLRQLGASRVEVSNVLQGLRLACVPGWRVSLHLPEVPVAVARRSVCRSGTQWHHPSFPVALYWRDNAVYYANRKGLDDLPALGVDRLVYRLGPWPLYASLPACTATDKQAGTAAVVR